jgi:NADH:ubiquinone reductase (H+-translocating)
METKPHHVVIVGGGFGGLDAAIRLRRAPVRVTLVDRRNFHLFQPLLYQVATGGLSPGDIAIPLRHILRNHRNASVLLAEVVDFDAAHRRLLLSDGELSYDTLIVSTGAHYHYFGHDDWSRLAPGLGTIEDATEIRRRILLAFEAAEREADPERLQEWLTFVVVGGGPTGVELAGALAELAQDTLRHEFRAVDPVAARILLVEGADRVLPRFPPGLSARTSTALARLGVQILTKALVTDIQADSVSIRVGERTEIVQTRTVLWAAGVRASRLGQKLAQATGTEVDPMGRLTVGPDLSLPGHPEILVIGDLARCSGQDGKLLPGLGAVAQQQGTYAAKLVRCRLRGQNCPPFRYWNYGTMATIGRAAAVADFGRFQLWGYLGWLAWLFVHLMKLVEFENRVLVLTQWAWNYFTHNRSARLITGTNPLPFDR